LIIAVNDGYEGIFFLDTTGETGKTFLISLVLASIRAQSQIALAVASSGIATTFLEGERTANSAHKLPLNSQMVDKLTCNSQKISNVKSTKKLENNHLG